MTPPVLYLRGAFVAPAEATVSMLDRGYLLGEGVFATLRGYGGACFRPEAHLAVLARGAELFGIAHPPIDALAELTDEAARRTGVRDAYVRVTLTAGAPGEEPTLSIVAREMDVPSDDAYARGVDAVTLQARRVPPACADGTIKTTSYGLQVLARRAAGSSEGIQLSVDGALACGAMSNLFLVVGDRLLTPSLESGCRAGITRSTVLEIASEIGFRPSEERLDPSALAEADEVFLTSTRLECLPLARVDGNVVGRHGAQSFPRTRSLRAALVARILAETAARRSR